MGALTQEESARARLRLRAWKSRDPRDPPLRKGAVYLLEAPSVGLLKIGVSSNLEVRIAGLQHQSPVPLVLRCSLPGGIALERELHARFAALRSHGEWFRLEGPLAEFIRDVSQ